MLSRCLQFHLKNLSPEQISAHLAQVLGQEQIEFETPALWSLAEAAQGSMRDALSLTDQAIAHGAGAISAVAVTEMLGYVDRELLGALIDALLAADAAAVLAALATMAQQGTDFERALAELLVVLHRVALVQAVPAMLDTLHNGLFYLVPLFSAASLAFGIINGLIAARLLEELPDTQPDAPR